MLLRHLLTNFVRQTAQQKLKDAVQERVAAGEAAPSEPPPQAEIVCVFALGAEAGGFVDLLSNSVASRCNTFFEYAGTMGDRRIAVIETGVGETAAARATRDALAMHEPSWVVSAGFAGALQADLKRGHLLMPDQLVRQQGECLDVGLRIDHAEIAANPTLHTGRLLTVDKLVRTSAEKRSLADQHNAAACDMESFAVAEVCRAAKVRFLSVRIISDALEDELPAEVEQLLDQNTLASKLGAATGAIFNRPSSIKDMWALKEQAIKASDRLARFLTGTIAQLPI